MTPPLQFDLDQARRDASTIAELEPEILPFAHFGPRAYDAEQLQVTSARWWSGSRL